HGKFPERDGGLFSEKQSAEMWSAQTILSTEVPPQLAAMKPRFSAYGLGWGLRDYHGRKLVSHSGGVAGTVTRVMLVPEENLGVVVRRGARRPGARAAVCLEHQRSASGGAGGECPAGRELAAAGAHGPGGGRPVGGALGAGGAAGAGRSTGGRAPGQPRPRQG